MARCMACGGSMQKTPTMLPRKKTGGATKTIVGMPGYGNNPKTDGRILKKGGPVKSFPDMSGDGKVTKKDILMGRGVIKKKSSSKKKK
jgi:hypothetical protein